DVAALALAMVGADVLNSDEARLRTAERAPEPAPDQPLPDAVDAPVEVVRGEECKVSADVAVALDHVVGVLRHVLLVTREHDQVVTPRQLVPARDSGQVV